MATPSPSPFLTADRLALFPDSTRVRGDALTIADLELTMLARQYGTPLYLYDRATMDAAVAAYAGALRAHYGAPSGITYAGKAYLCTAIAQWTQLQRLWVDCTGQGELAVAQAGGVPREKIVVHGVNKSHADLAAAVEGAGILVVDHPRELEHLAGLPAGQAAPEVWLRLQPGVAVQTHHAHTQTGQEQSKFGMTPAEIRAAARFCREHGLRLTGLHFHLGSNFRDSAPLIPALSLALDLARQIGFGPDWHLSPGGGWAVAYHEDELPEPPVEDYVRVLSESVVEGCRARGLSLPMLHLEPGRSLIARAGVAVYQVGARKQRTKRTWLLVDGGMADNPRHALYGARYTCLPVEGISREPTGTVSIGGPYCESGDVLIEDLWMPRVEEGEWIAIPVSGAYHLSMSGNYNGARRPAVLWLDDQGARLIQRRETLEDLRGRDIMLR